MAADLIYCAGGNIKFLDIALSYGYLYGAQLPYTIHEDLYFADQDWKNPDFDKYVSEVEKYKPRMATVIDLESEEQLDEVMMWAERISKTSEIVVIIPKDFGIISRLPKTINGSEVRLGYSVPTKYGGTEVPLWEFYDWPVHLLGGSPHKQMKLRRYLNVKSADGNMTQKIALKFCKFWEDGKWFNMSEQTDDAPYKAFEISCRNVAEAWRNME